MSKDIFKDYIKTVTEEKKNNTENNTASIMPANKSDISSYLDKSIENITKTLINGISVSLDKAITNSNLNFLNNNQTSATSYNTYPVYDLAINNGHVIIPGIAIVNANIGVLDGKIATISTNAINADKVINASGMFVSPGIIDPHVHIGLFAPFEKELESETKAAIAGGVTTLGCFIGSQVSHFDTFPKIEESVKEYSSVDILPHLIINNDTQKKEIKDYVKHLGVTSFKLYMNGIPGIVPDIDDGFMIDVFEQIKKADKKCIICVHAENKFLVNRAMEKTKRELGEHATVVDWSETHPDMAEEEAVIRLSYLSKKMGVNVYMVHISSKSAIERLEKIKSDNRFINIETTSPYLSINNKSVNNNMIKMEPPIRSSEDVEMLWEAIENGTIDSIGTDNVTMTAKEKNINANLWDVVPGYPATETHLPVMLNEGVIKRRIPIEKIIELMTKKPAQIFGIYPQKGSMLVGSDADITIIDLNKTKEVDINNLYSRSDFSIYQGKTLQGWPVVTIKNGKIVFENGCFTDEKANCKCIFR